MTQGSISRDCDPMVICQQNPELFSWRSRMLTFTMEMNLKGWIGSSGQFGFRQIKKWRASIKALGQWDRPRSDQHFFLHLFLLNTRYSNWINHLFVAASRTSQAFESNCKFVRSWFKLHSKKAGVGKLLFDFTWFFPTWIDLSQVGF